jgi:hypothetical protein
MQNVENIVQDRQIKHGPKHGAKMLMVDLALHCDAVVFMPGFCLPWWGQLVKLLVARSDGLAASRTNVRCATLTGNTSGGAKILLVGALS